MENLEDIKKNLGVDLLGVCDASSMDNILDILKTRPKDFMTKFESDNYNLRVDPKLSLKDAKSVFVLGLSYIWDEPDNIDFKISNHARSLDYHKVMGKRLDHFSSIIRNMGYNTYTQVDNGTLYERELARRAGLGFIGKNGLLINKTYGSYIFLGILVTDLNLDNYSSLDLDTCGDCKICEKACPSCAILGDYKLNPSICHSYLTQIKETYEETYNILYAYGCDICQKVCPKNKDIIYNKNEEFRPINFSIDKSIKDLSNRQFREKYKDYSFSWVGKKTLVRNLEILEKRGR